MRIMLHDSYEKKLITLADNMGITPSMLVKALILESYNRIECTLDAQGGNNGRDKEKEEF